MIVSNLGVRLIGVGAYRSPLPPDPLATILDQDTRFVNAGLDMVALANRWPGYATEPVDVRDLLGSAVPGVPEVGPGGREE